MPTESGPGEQLTTAKVHDAFQRLWEPIYFCFHELNDDLTKSPNSS